jgi:uncharacterized protein
MRPARALITLVSAIGLLAILDISPSAAQSFNCRSAEKPDEVLICQRPELAALDERMSSLFFRLRNSLGGSARARLIADQRDWLASRTACGRDYDCIRDTYRERIRALREDY